MKKAIIIGRFGANSNQLCGQTVKTRIIADGLVHYFGRNATSFVDTGGGIKTLCNAKRIVDRSLSGSNNVVIMPAQNGLRVFAPLCSLGKNKYPHAQLHYVVIGGWLPSFIKKRPWLARHLRRFDAIYVETSSMKNAMEAMEFANVVVMPNCKNLEILSENELVYNDSEPFKLCTFSRVMKEKGIEDAVEAVKAVNDFFGREVYQLDIYGQVQAGQEEWFEHLAQSFPSYIKHVGVVPFDESVSVIKNYFALLFPTRFFTEGVPGTIIDAYAAGVPVISARWENYSDVIDDNITGIGYSFGDIEELERVLCVLAEKPDTVTRMKSNCLQKAMRYLPEEAMRGLLKNMESSI